MLRSTTTSTSSSTTTSVSTTTRRFSLSMPQRTISHRPFQRSCRLPKMQATKFRKRRRVKFRRRLNAILTTCSACSRRRQRALRTTYSHPIHPYSNRQSWGALRCSPVGTGRNGKGVRPRGVSWPCVTTRRRFTWPSSCFSPRRPPRGSHLRVGSSSPMRVCLSHSDGAVYSRAPWTSSSRSSRRTRSRSTLSSLTTCVRMQRRMGTPFFPPESTSVTPL
mmetsp:Transcript_1555/g.3463  ORF Transcript_1555/g.3463 Transcript_1555/m.3463 type:complete len:220 (+) Transcript_1555:1202-1861(+)